MGAIDEIRQLEEKLRQAELGPDPRFFEEHLADDAVIDGQPQKARVVEAHTPGSGRGRKFTKVEMSHFAFADHGAAVIVSCQGHFEGAGFSQTLQFMRVWLKKDGRWTIIAASTSTAS